MSERLGFIDWLDRGVRWLASSSSPAWWAAALVVLFFLALELVRTRLRRWLERARLRRQSLRAHDAETLAARLLVRAGYRILGAQVRGAYELSIDGRPILVTLRADYVVERRGRPFVAEVKSGQFAPSIENAATRRQLLEYRMAFAVEGVLLVDAEAGDIREVVFPGLFLGLGHDDDLDAPVVRSTFG